jgi:hypothetical protein
MPTGVSAVPYENRAMSGGFAVGGRTSTLWEENRAAFFVVGPSGFAQDRVVINGANGSCIIAETAVVEPDYYDPMPRSRFGRAVAIAGMTAVVTSLGRAHVFRRVSCPYEEGLSAWMRVAVLYPPDGISDFGADFGVSAAITRDGRTIVVGNSQGVHVFDASNADWTHLPNRSDLLIPWWGATSVSVNEDGDTLAVGNPDAGRAIVFDRPGTLHNPSANWVWTELELPHLDPGIPLFGWSVSTSGDKVVVGHPQLLEDPNYTTLGAAHVFQRLDSQWVRQFELMNPGVNRFGRWAALEGETAIVTGEPYSHPVSSLPSAAYAYRLDDVQRCTRYGDATLDGLFGMADLNALIDFILGRSPLEPLASYATDVNGDRQAGMTDLNLFVDCLLGRIERFPVEPTTSQSCGPQGLGGPVSVNTSAALTKPLTTHSGNPFFSITATFKNISDSSFILKPFFKVTTLMGPGCPCTVEGFGGVGSEVPIDVGDSLWLPGEEFTHTFRILLTRKQKFTFFVDIMGIKAGP